VQNRATPLAPLVVLLPTLNEEEGVRATIQDIPFQELWDAGFDPRVLVVDGRSTDRTREVAVACGATVVLQSSRGKGGAVREGLEWATDRGVPYVVVMDADYTYPGSSLPTIATLLAAGSDMVIGIRRPDRHAMSELRGLVHRVGNGVLNFLSGYLARGTILDVCSGLWGMRSSVIPRLSLVSEGFDIEAEAFVKAFRMGLSVSQVPVVYRDRIGTAKLHAFQDGSRILLSILRYSRSTRGAPGAMNTPVSTSAGPLPPAIVRDLESVLFALNNLRVFVSPPSGPSSSAYGLVDQLRDSAPDLQVEVVSSRPRPSTGGVRGRPTSTGPSPGVDPGTPWSMVITLPEGRLHGVGQSCTIHVPEGEHLLYLDLAPSEKVPEQSEDPAGLGRSRAFRFERSSERPFSSLRFLSSSLAQFPAQRELALIDANVAHSDYAVYRARPGTGPETMRTPERTPELVPADGAMSSARD
jgi:dolichol-phosphate hexosyltransferase